MTSRFTAAQQLTQGWPEWLRALFGVPAWRCPPAESLERMTTRTIVTSTGSAPPWPSTLGDLSFGVSNGTVPWEGSLPGMPVQRVSAATEQWLCIDPWMGDEVSHPQLPLPVAGFRWIEGHPSRDGAWDRHWIGYDPSTGISYEVILCFVDQRRMARLAVFGPDGQVLAGRPVTAAGESLSRLVLGANEPDHRLGIILPDYAAGPNANGGPSDGTGEFAWPRCGSLVRLKPEVAAVSIAKGGQEARVARMLLNHGAVFHDRGGIATIAAQAGVPFPRMSWKLRDLEPAQSI